MRTPQTTRMRLAAILGGLLATTGASAGVGEIFDVPWIGYDTTVYPEGHVSWASHLADFDGDGALDLAVSSWYSNNQLSILRGDGDAGFLPPEQYELMLGGLGLTAADFDNDGDLDIVVSDTGQFWEGTTFSLFENLGDGGFATPSHWPCGAGPTGITAADFNGDGWMDVAVAHDAYIESGNSIAVMLNNGAGGFGAPRVYSLTGGTYKLDAGDLDGDGDPDLAIAHEGNRVTTLLNDGAANFGPVATYTGLDAGSIITEPVVRLADVDLDDDLDVLYSHSSSGGYNNGAIALFRNDGAGNLSSPESLPLVAGADGAVDIAVADVTGDGWPDVLGAVRIHQLWTILVGDQAGGFLPGVELRAGEDPIAVQAGDLDGDGDRDVVVTGRDSLEAAVYRNPGAGDFEQPPVLDMVDPTLAPVSLSNLASDDIDADGDLDLVVGFSANFDEQYGVSVRRNQGDGTFGEPEIYSRPRFPGTVKLRDMNGDGALDVLYLEDRYPAKFWILYNDGAGTFDSVYGGQTLFCDGGAIDAFDMDGDGDLDVVAGPCYGWLDVALNHGSSFGTFLSHEVSGTPNALGAGDFDQDGNLDVVTGSGVQGWFEVSFGNGDGTFRATYELSSGRNVTDIAVEDLDGDGALDIAGSFGLDGNGLTIRRGRGDGNFFPSREYHGGYSATWDNVFSIALGDVDGDGALDAMSANYGSQDVSVWRGLGDGTFEQQVRLGVGQQAVDLRFGDYDGDGTGDLAVLCEPHAFAPNGWYYPGVVFLWGVGGTGGLPGDLDGDGDVDLTDLSILLGIYGTCDGDAGYDAIVDIDGSGCVDLADLSVLLSHYGS